MVFDLFSQIGGYIFMVLIWLIIMIFFIYLAISSNAARMAALSTNKSLREQNPTLPITSGGDLIIPNKEFVTSIEKLATSVSHMWASAIIGSILSAVAAIISICQLVLTLKDIISFTP
jgi:hypothetical protein